MLSLENIHGALQTWHVISQAPPSKQQQHSFWCSAYK